MEAINKELDKMKEWGFVVLNNITLEVNWAYAEEMNGAHLTPKQESMYEAALDECYRAEWLIQRSNHLNKLLHTRTNKGAKA